MKNITGKRYYENVSNCNREVLSLICGSSFSIEEIINYKAGEIEIDNFPLYYLEFRYINDPGFKYFLIDIVSLDSLMRKTLSKRPEMLKKINTRNKIENIRRSYLKKVLFRLFDTEINISFHIDNDNFIIKPGIIKDQKSYDLFLKKILIKEPAIMKYHYSIFESVQAVDIITVCSSEILFSMDSFFQRINNMKYLEGKLNYTDSKKDDKIFLDYQNNYTSICSDKDIILKNPDDLIFSKLFDSQYNSDIADPFFSEIYLDKVLITNFNTLKQEGKCFACRVNYSNEFNSSYIITLHSSDTDKDNNVELYKEITNKMYKSNIYITERLVKKKINARIVMFNEYDFTKAVYNFPDSVIIVLKYRAVDSNGTGINFNIYISCGLINELIYKLANFTEVEHLTKEMMLMNILDLNFVLYEQAAYDTELKECLLKGTDFYNAVRTIGEGDVYNIISTVAFKYSDMFGIKNSEIQLFISRINYRKEARKVFSFFLFSILPEKIRDKLLCNMSKVFIETLREEYPGLLSMYRRNEISYYSVLTEIMTVYESLVDANKININNELRSQFVLNYKLLNDYYRRIIADSVNQEELYKAIMDLSEPEKKNIVGKTNISDLGYVLYMDNRKTINLVKRYLTARAKKDLESELQFIRNNSNNCYYKMFEKRNDLLYRIEMSDDIIFIEE